MATSIRRHLQGNKNRQGKLIETKTDNHIQRKTQRTVIKPVSPHAQQQIEEQKSSLNSTVKQEPVSRARRLQVRRGSQKYEMTARDLREKRVDQHHIKAQRLQKVLAFSGLGSRRDMEALIESGRVEINGKVAKLGDKVSLSDTVRIDGKGVRLKWQDRLPRIVLYHKQAGELVSRHDPKGRNTIFDRLPRLQSSQWVAVGRLDYNTSGLLILTTSGDLANRMLHPRFAVEREYAVRLVGELNETQRYLLLQGIDLEDGPAKFERLEDLGGEGLNHWYRLVIHEGRNREIRRMFAHLQITVSRLMRTRFGTVALPSRLKCGQFYELNEHEVLSVLRWAGLQMNGMAKKENVLNHE